VNASLLTPSGHVWFYRSAALLGLLAASLALALVPQHMVEPEEWSFRFAAQNFAHGQLVIGDDAFQRGVEEAAAGGGQIQQYVNIAPGQWAFAEAPGYVFFLLPFQAAGAPGLGNILLFLALAAATYLLLARLRNEKAAATGTLLLIFTPALMEMTQRPWVDSLAALAFPALGGAVYICYLLRPEEARARRAAALLGLAGFCLACGVAVSYGNGLIAFVFLLHFGVTRLDRRGRGSRGGREALFLGLGALLPLLALAAYQWSVFGGPFANGYQFSAAPPRFAFDYLWTGHAWQIIRSNFAQLWAALLVAFPGLMLALTAFPLFLRSHLSPRLPCSKGRAGDSSGPNLPAHLLWLLAAWFLAVYGLYLMYEWTANTVAWNLPYIVLTRFYLPGLMPLVIVSALLVERLPSRLLVSITATAVVLGLLFFAMAAATTVVFQGPTVTVTAMLPLARGWLEIG
jgi:hypothetical protein